MIDEHSFDAVCKEFEVDPDSGMGSICHQFYVRGYVAATSTTLPQTAEDVIAFVGMNFAEQQFAADADDVKYTLFAHDLLTSFRELALGFKFAPLLPRDPNVDDMFRRVVAPLPKPHEVGP